MPDLAVQVLLDHLSELPHERAPGLGVAVHHLLRPCELSTRRTFDHVSGERERRPGEANQRHPIQLGEGGVYRIEDVAHMGFRLELVKVGNIGGVPDRVGDDRSQVLLNPEFHPHPLEWEHYVGEDYPRVDPELIDGVRNRLRRK